MIGSSRTVTVYTAPTHWYLSWFFLSVSQTDFLESRIDFLRDGSSPTGRVVTIRHRLYSPYTLVLELIFSKCLTNWLSEKSDRLSKRRVVTNWSGRHDPSPFIQPPTHWCLSWFFLSVSRNDFLKSRIDFLRDGSSLNDRVVTNRHRLYSPYTLVLELIFSKCLTNWLSGKSDRLSKRRVVTNWSGRHDPSPFIQPLHTGTWADFF